MDYEILPALHLATSDNLPSLTLVTLSKINRDGYKYEEEILKKHNLQVMRHFGYFSVDSLQELDGRLEELCSKLSPFYRNSEREYETDRIYPSLRTFSNFLASVSLTTQTRMLQSQVYNRLKSSVSDLDKRVSDERTNRIYFYLRENKQRRKISELITAKERIMADGIPTIGQAGFDYQSIMKHYTAQIIKSVNEVSQRWPPPLSDD